TLIMEVSSARAFDTLNKIYDNITVRVIRDGTVLTISQRFVTVGDIILIESGDKIVADGRLVESNSLTVDESVLTGESLPVKKQADVVINNKSLLAERINMVYSGTFVASGSGKMVVTQIGDSTEIGKIASELENKKDGNSPLENKLSKLGKTISISGIVCAVIVFILSIMKLTITKTLTFTTVQGLFIECIILIVAAVPEGLPTIVALSLALNMIKLAKENALIKKMVATETMGSVSVICSDKTGTLTQNKMAVKEFCNGLKCSLPEKIIQKEIMQNFICNTTADIIVNNDKIEYVGSGTECALIQAVKNNTGISYKQYREQYPVLFRIPFDSKYKFMITGIQDGGIYRLLLKGAPEKVIEKCTLNDQQKTKILTQITARQNQAERVLCFAHKDILNGDFKDNENGYTFDGYAILSDPIRPEVFKAVLDCKRAGISIKMLTGDNQATAFAIAKQLGIATDQNQVVNASYLDTLTEEELKKVLKKVNVVARSTPLLKLKIVKALKSMGEVVAVTGDGINDAPAIRHADVGVAMGISGSEITKETADVVLLDDSFSTVVKAITFGRNVYRNLQRFILFQLSVNVSALLFITTCALLGLDTPFNALQLLWINIIMDGPPALTLGLERASDNLMNLKPIRKDQSIVNKTMLLRIIFKGVFIVGIVLLQHLTNFMKVGFSERSGTVFTLFILFQLFNAFNSRELGDRSIFKNVGKNKVMIVTFASIFLLHAVIVTLFPTVFGVGRLSFLTYIKCIFLSVTVVLVSELYKLLYKIIKNHK
ncbi:MAG: calcium-translocating P-type ATPase, PMCA-type, partial [Clostridia bacterium]|nr:calcium-translocating P-type ATPase, PMCA-type [Clostridia bacterium]